jgi:hypothetical protein
VKGSPLTSNERVICSLEARALDPEPLRTKSLTLTFPDLALISQSKITLAFESFFTTF